MELQLLEQSVREAFIAADIEGKGVMAKAAFENLLRMLGLDDDIALAYALAAASESSAGMISYHRFLDWTFSDEEALPPRRGGVELEMDKDYAIILSGNGSCDPWAAAVLTAQLRSRIQEAIGGSLPAVVYNAASPAAVTVMALPGSGLPGEREVLCSGTSCVEVQDLVLPEPPAGQQKATAPWAGSSGPSVADPTSAAWRGELAAEFGSRPVPINDTALRGITLRQLRRVLSFCEAHCGCWRDTAPPGGSGTSGRELDMGFLNLYHVNEWVVKPATMNRPCGSSDSCAFVELLAAEPQQPLWYVSHWWGEPVQQFQKCLELHAAQRALGLDAPFWVCAYANRQHDLGRELAADPTASSFFRAMRLCRGVLLVVDSPSDVKEPVNVFRRIWVQFEEAMTFRLADEQDFRLDIVTTPRGGAAQLLADGETELDRSRKVLSTARKTIREKEFPIEVMGAALQVTMLKAEASNEDDRRHILNCVAGRPLDGAPPPAHEAFEQTDRRLHSLFALAAWPQAAAKGLVTEMGLPKALAADVWRKRLTLDLHRCEALTSTRELAEGLAGLRSLTQLKLLLASCRRLSDIDDLSVALSGLSSLEDLNLHFGCCNQLQSVDQLGRSLEKLQSLTSVVLHLEGCSAIFDLSVLYAGLGRLSGLRCLRLFLHGCAGARNVGELGRALAEKGQLEDLHLVLAGCTQLSSASELGMRLPGFRALRALTVNLSTCNQLTSVDEIGTGLAGLRGAPLELLSLGFSHCSGLRSFSCLAQGISEAGGCLRSLSLWFKGCVRAYSGAAELGQALPALRELENLELCLADCRGLPPAELLSLARGLAEMRPPARFEVDFSGCRVEPRLRRRFDSHAEFCAEAALVSPSSKE